MENENLKNPAEKIALLPQNEKLRSNKSFRYDIAKINSSSENIESKITRQNSQAESSVKKTFHPSQEKFPNLEELAVEDINSPANEKACPFEPTGKPCDHCSMCDSLGF